MAVYTIQIIHGFSSDQKRGSILETRPIWGKDIGIVGIGYTLFKCVNREYIEVY